MTQLTFEDYTLPLEAVVSKEVETPELMVDGFITWVRANPSAWKAVYRKALDLAYRRKYVSANYLVGWLRNDWDGKLVQIDDKNVSFPNEYSPILARYLAKASKDIEEVIEIKKSKFDGVELPPLF